MVETLDSGFFVEQQQPPSTGSVSLSLAPGAAPTAYNTQQPGSGQPQWQPQPQLQQSQPLESPIPTQQAVGQLVAGRMARSAAEQTVGLLRKGAGEIRVYIERNHYSVHALSLCGGLALAFVSALGLLNIFGSLLGPLSYLLHGYQLSFGIVLCIIDGPGEKWPRAQAAIVQNVPFLHHNAGRSLFYLFIACLEGSQDSWVHDILGWYFLVIAVMHIVLKFKSLNSRFPENDDKTQELLQPPAIA